MKRMKQRKAYVQAACHVTTSDVLECAKTFGDAAWTTHDIADRLGEKEHRIRGFVSWLENKGSVKSVGSVRIPTLRTRDRWTVTEHYDRALYRVVEKGGEPDLATLEMALGFCRAFVGTLVITERAPK